MKAQSLTVRLPNEKLVTATFREHGPIERAFVRVPDARGVLRTVTGRVRRDFSFVPDQGLTNTMLVE